MEMFPLRHSTRVKRPVPGSQMCDHEIVEVESLAKKKMVVYLVKLNDSVYPTWEKNARAHVTCLYTRTSCKLLVTPQSNRYKYEIAGDNNTYYEYFRLLLMYSLVYFHNVIVQTVS